MPEKVRVAVVGSGTLRGKELMEALEDSSFAAAEFLLMDDDEALGQIEAIGDELTVIQKIDADSFQMVDYVFFAGAPAQTSARQPDRSF
jgi:aspartate-semialdehyde dehydrogenase